MRTVPRFAVAIAAGVGLLVSTLGAAVSTAQEYDHPVSGEYAFSMTATEAQVNAAGGLFVTGELTCPATAIDQALADAVALAVQDGYTLADHATLNSGVVLANANWVATQYVGRTKVVTASYDSGIASPCYGFPDGPPYAWRTLYGFPVGGDQWVYSDTGRFSTGRIHIEVAGYASETVNVFTATDDYLTSYTATFYASSGADLRAVRYRTR